MTGAPDGSPGANVAAQAGGARGNGASGGDTLLTVTGLTKHFPVKQGVFSHSHARKLRRSER